MRQLALNIGLAPEPTLDSFVPGENAAVLQHLRLWIGGADRSPVPIYLWGPTGAGKTHLLRAVRGVLQGQGAPVGWLDARTPASAAFDESWAAVLMDDVHQLGPGLQHLAFNWFVNAVAPASGRPRAVLAAGCLPPADLPLREDLRTRLGWGHVFELHSLSDPALRAALREAARARGLALADEVVDYVLARFARDLASLTGLLDRLDRYALQTRRAVTIPLIKSMLQEE
ncbi:MAG TPA: DnaA regulatory inactivator Hda [Ottowia sp.]|uniref:DnaA regulatory inactivator Hda n=1 Tax=Ottowia sp. TaxID=1898956 RepID=UPI002BAEBD1D|nr:DnaA regulatory inactivator Hda [Ottowia sp.]HMN21900.1 DnaA regulatory inactivator Hda [Ottowia sp.]